MHHVKVNKMNIINWISIYIYKAEISSFVFVCVCMYVWVCLNLIVHMNYLVNYIDLSCHILGLNVFFINWNGCRKNIKTLTTQKWINKKAINFIHSTSKCTQYKKKRKDIYHYYAKRDHRIILIIEWPLVLSMSWYWNIDNNLHMEKMLLKILNNDQCFKSLRKCVLLNV